MVVGGLVAVFCAVSAEGRSLEDIAAPLSAQDPSQAAEAGKDGKTGRVGPVTDPAGLRH
jgi:hypothetical protein